ncbi:MAG: transporter [SAR324 cluster bacterium]|nr:transporter [SAR324 cluster bacterium]
MVSCFSQRNRRLPELALLTTLFTALIWTDVAWGAPVTFNTALPVSKGHFVLREQFLFRRSGDDPSNANREVDVYAVVSALGYGIDRRLALFGVLPYLDKRLSLEMDGRRITRETQGIGDLTVFGRYTVFQDDAPGRTFRVAPFLGTEIPTGENTASDKFGRLPPALQLGSGSWDPFAGVVTTYQTLGYQIDAQARYQDHTEADGVEIGNLAEVDASLQYRILPGELGGGGVPAFLYGVLEANLVRQDKTRIDGNNDPDSGGTSLFLAPGLQYVTTRWILETAVQVPVVQNLNGDALETGFVFRAGFRVNL